jgi:hypothetical protein
MPGLINLKLLTDFFNKIGPKRRFAAPQRYVGNWGYSGPVWCMLEKMQLTCSPLSRSPNEAATAMAAG